MRTDQISLRPRTSPFAPSPHRGHRPAGTWFAKGIVVTLFLLSGAVFAPRAAKADITYTWHEDDGQSITGSMTVQSAVQAAGQIPFSDVTSFNFNFDNVPEGSFPFSSLTSFTFPLPISPLDASPMAPPTTGTELEAVKSTTYFMSVQFDANWSTTFGEAIIVENVAIGLGDGHWIITGASPAAAVPEPSTAVVAGIGVVCGLAYAWCRHRRDQRRQRPMGPPDATEDAANEFQGPL